MTDKAQFACPACGCSIEVEAEADDPRHLMHLVSDMLTHYRNAHKPSCGHGHHVIAPFEIAAYGPGAKVRVLFTLGAPFESVEEAPEPAMKAGTARKRTPRRKRPA